MFPYNIIVGREKVGLCRSIIMILAVAALIVMLMAATVSPAFAAQQTCDRYGYSLGNQCRDPQSTEEDPEYRAAKSEDR
jgi:hypothetical protein